MSKNNKNNKKTNKNYAVTRYLNRPMYGKKALKANKLPTYNKKKFVPILKQINCNPNKEARLTEKFRCINDTNLIKEYIDSQAVSAQERITLVMHDENNEKFINLDNWANYFCKTKSIYETDNSLTMVLEMIAKTEKFPSPDLLNGIDLKKMYMTLVNLMAGYATEELNGPSKRFLKECFQELMQTVSNPIENNGKSQQLKEIVNKQLCNRDEDTKPTDLNSNDDKVKKIIDHPEINPLQLPSSFCLK